MHPAAALWQEQLGTLDAWFQSARERHGDTLPCRRGCNACCLGPFDISTADALLLREGLRALPPAAAGRVRERAGALLRRMLAEAPGWPEPWDIRALGEDRFDALADRLAVEPCPLLDEKGGCSVYDHRPLVCRMIGLPMMTADGEVLENACPIIERFPGYAGLDPALFDLEALEAREAAALEAAALELFDATGQRDFETTIAAAVVRFIPEPGGHDA